MAVESFDSSDVLAESPRPGFLAPGEVALGVVLATATMLFAGFSSVYLVRRESFDWSPLAIPDLLWVNSAILAASSLVIEWASRQAKRGERGRTNLALGTALALGFGFLAGQIALFRDLASLGVSMSNSAHGSFVYVLSTAHGLHAAGGLAAIGACLLVSLRRNVVPAPLISLTRIYWHFLGLVWAFLALLLFAL